MAPCNSALGILEQTSHHLTTLGQCAPQFVAFLAESERWKGKQHPLSWDHIRYNVLAQFQRWQVESFVVKSEIRRLTHCPSPRTHPAPKCFFGMPLEPPLKTAPFSQCREASISPLCITRARVILKEAIEHIHITEISQRFARGSQFDVIVRRGSRRTEQPVTHLTHEVSDELSPYPIEGLDSA